MTTGTLAEFFGVVEVCKAVFEPGEGWMKERSGWAIIPRRPVRMNASVNIGPLLYIGIFAHAF